MTSPFYNIDHIVKKKGAKEWDELISGLKPIFRLILSAPSGQGKTNIIWHLIMSYVYFDKLLVFSLSLDQDKYKWLIRFFKKVDEERKKEWEQDKRKKDNKKNNMMYDENDAVKIKMPVIKRKKKEDDDDSDDDDDDDDDEQFEPIAEFYDKLSDFPTLDSLGKNKKKHTLVVLDDCLALDQTRFSEMFIRARHKKASIIYATQKYEALPTALSEQSTHNIFIGNPTRTLLNTIVASCNIGLDYDGMKVLFNDHIKSDYDFLFFNKYAPRAKKVLLNLVTPIDISGYRDADELRKNRKTRTSGNQADKLS